ncbi:tubulin gamma [Pancytospora epiphaga]|nr:tubulin gamma [Pancytospora epiphaga]
MHEVVTLQVGQCGNQIGNDFWKKVASEHSICCDGVLEASLEDRKDRYFYQTDDGRYVPRAVLIDLEPRVVGQRLPFFNSDNVFVSNEGGGAGNNWAHGYYAANKVREDISEVIQREVEGCDAVEAFYMMHSVAGGTGAGAGSLIVEQLRDLFPKKIISTYSILPTNEEGSEVVVQPYNTVLTLAHLAKPCDSIMLMDNCALGRMAMNATRACNPTFNIINTLAAVAISATSSTVRFPSNTFCDARSILSCSVPVPDLKFIIPSYTPFSVDVLHGMARKTSVSDVLRGLLLPKTRLCAYEGSSAHSCVAVLNILEGADSSENVSRAVTTIKNQTTFVPWMPPFYQTALSRRIPELNRVTGLSLNNTTACAVVIRKICAQFDRLRKHSAFMEMYRKFDACEDQFNMSREYLENFINIYERAQTTWP